MTANGRPVWRWLLALSVIAPAVDSRSSHAEADGPDYFAVHRVAVGDVLHIRAEALASSAKIGEIPHDGRGVQNLGCQGGPTFAESQQMSATEREQAGRKRWCRIRYQEAEGWVAGWFLREDSTGPLKEPAGQRPR